MSYQNMRLLLTAASLAAIMACSAENTPASKTTPPAFDPVAMDLIQIDETNPPTTIELSFDSHGNSLNGHLYLANGAGPHPTVILLHGLPGNERNLDIAQAVRRAGFNVLFFHYRGAWGSEGDFSFTNIVEDALAAADYLRSDEAVADYRIDPTRIIYLGHSMGGHTALTAGARDKTVFCVGAMSPANLHLLAAGLQDEEAAKGFSAHMDKLGENGDGPNYGPLRGIDGPKAVAEIVEIGSNNSLRDLAPEFIGRSLLITGAKNDTVLPASVFYEPLVTTLEAQSALDLSHKLFESDHSYSWERIALTHTVLDWLNSKCR